METIEKLLKEITATLRQGRGNIGEMVHDVYEDGTKVYESCYQYSVKDIEMAIQKLNSLEILIKEKEQQHLHPSIINVLERHSRDIKELQKKWSSPQPKPGYPSYPTDYTLYCGVPEC